MKLIDDRVQVEEVVEISNELLSILVEILQQDYEILLDSNQTQFLTKEFQILLSKFFDVED